jgi:hypothetical protein
VQKKANPGLVGKIFINIGIGFGLWFLLTILISMIIASSVFLLHENGTFLFFIFYSPIISFFLTIVYLYVTNAFLSIAKKLNYEKPNYAWIPIIGPMIILSETAKMHWWPILIYIFSVFLMVRSLIFGAVSLIFTLIYIPIIIILPTIYLTIWTWKTFKILNKPGWWSLFILPVGMPITTLIHYFGTYIFNHYHYEINFLGINYLGLIEYNSIVSYIIIPIIFLVLLGIVAWSKNKKY